ncbi:MAG: (d)CMP kinase [Nitrospiraceae bacterium]|nr:MAG: (d)CMP kinase [Nitrospiraceae bacterium]
MKDVITIDGPSGAGKSTVARLLAAKLGYNYLDTGALYRAVAWKVRDSNIDHDNEDALRDLLKTAEISLEGSTISVNGTDVTTAIRTKEIGELSSQVSAKPIVREFLFAMQREEGIKGKVVVEGRDTGTVIFPESENKFFLDASVDERWARRLKDLKDSDPTLTLDTTVEDLKKRDHRDSTRESAPLKKADDMFYIDSSRLSPEEVVDTIVRHLK